MTVGEFVEELKKLDPNMLVVYPHELGDGFEDISRPAFMELVRRTDAQMAPALRGRTLSRYRAIMTAYEKPNVKCIAI